MENPPAYQWYPSDWFASMRVRKMDLAQQAAYRNLLDAAWLQRRWGWLPDDDEELRAMSGWNERPLNGRWTAVRSMFKKGRYGLYNPRQQHEIRKLRKRRADAVRAGKASAAKRLRSNARSTPGQRPGNTPTPTPTPTSFPQKKDPLIPPVQNAETAVQPFLDAYAAAYQKQFGREYRIDAISDAGEMARVITADPDLTPAEFAAIARWHWGWTDFKSGQSYTGADTLKIYSLCRNWDTRHGQWLAKRKPGDQDTPPEMQAVPWQCPGCKGRCQILLKHGKFEFIQAATEDGARTQGGSRPCYEKKCPACGKALRAAKEQADG